MSHFIIDCDPGHDDALAILLAARHLPLVGVTTVFGNSSVQNTTRNALAILDAAGLGHIPVASGAAAPLTGEVYTGESVHGKTGLDGANFPASTRTPSPLDAAEFIADAASRYDDLVIIAVAPETNVANAILRFPEVSKRVRHISV
ncbi:MAG: nucleoside hydrolase, partial [Pseudomonadales bacterium]|nr:nucleoside hydrolase [Pseudomonadales bacterium]